MTVSKSDPELPYMLEPEPFSCQFPYIETYPDFIKIFPPAPDPDRFFTRARS